MSSPVALHLLTDQSASIALCTLPYMHFPLPTQRPQIRRNYIVASITNPNCRLYLGRYFCIDLLLLSGAEALSDVNLSARRLSRNLTTSIEALCLHLT